METYKVLGIEAARQTILNEILEVIQFDGTYINYHHVSMLADRMTTNKKLVSIFRHGINNDDIGPIAKASFEETTEMFLHAARHGELDTLRGVSANVMCGQEGYYGTSAFQTYVDNDLLFEYIKTHQKASEEDDMFNINDENEIVIDENKSVDEIMEEYKNLQKDKYGMCSIENIKSTGELNENIASNVSKMENNDYELDI